MLEGLYLFYFCRICRFHIIMGSLKRYSQLHWCFQYWFFFQNWVFGCKARLGAVIAYEITQLICFIKFVHQICHCHTALPQMSLFLVTDFLAFFFFFDICFKVKINDKSLDILGYFWVLQVRYVHVSPIVMEKFLDT